MRLLTVLTTMLLLSSLAKGQTNNSRVPDALGYGYIGGNQIAGKHPKCYQDFLVMWVDRIGICRRDAAVNRRQNLLPGASGRISVCGRVVFKGWRYPQGDTDSDGKYRSYEFKEAYLIDLGEEPVRLVFDTRELDGVGYHFEGVYLEKRRVQSDDESIHLEGEMTKFLSGRKVSQAKLHFSPYRIIE
jgi:hypothetical protein